MMAFDIEQSPESREVELILCRIQNETKEPAPLRAWDHWLRSQPVGQGYDVFGCEIPLDDDSLLVMVGAHFVEGEDVLHEVDEVQVWIKASSEPIYSILEPRVVRDLKLQWRDLFLGR